MHENIVRWGFCYNRVSKSFGTTLKYIDWNGKILQNYWWRIHKSQNLYVKTINDSQITEISSKWNDFPLLRYMVYHLCSSVIITYLKTNTFSPSCLYSLNMVQIWKTSWTLLIILCKVQHQFKYSLLAQLAYTLWW